MRICWTSIFYEIEIYMNLINSFPSGDEELQGKIQGNKER